MREGEGVTGVLANRVGVTGDGRLQIRLPLIGQESLRGTQVGIKRGWIPRPSEFNFRAQVTLAR